MEKNGEVGVVLDSDETEGVVRIIFYSQYQDVLKKMPKGAQVRVIVEKEIPDIMD